MRPKARVFKYDKALRWCEEVVKETRNTITYCGKAAQPIFTKAIQDVGAGEHQPLWLCEQHIQDKVAVSPTGGHSATTQG